MKHHLRQNLSRQQEGGLSSKDHRTGRRLHVTALTVPEGPAVSRAERVLTGWEWQMVVEG